MMGGLYGGFLSRVGRFHEAKAWRRWDLWRQGLLLKCALMCLPSKLGLLIARLIHNFEVADQRKVV